MYFGWKELNPQSGILVNILHPFIDIYYFKQRIYVKDLTGKAKK